MRACAASSSRRSPSSAWRSSRVLRQHRGLVRAHVVVAAAAVHQLVLDGVDLVDLVLDLVRDDLGALLQLVEPLGGGDRVRLRAPDDADDPRVLLGHPLHELRALEQVGEAVGLQHHGHEIGLVGLVELDQAPGQRRARLGQPLAQPRQPEPLAPEVLLDLGQLGPLAVQARLEAHLAGLERRDLALERVDPPRVARDVGRQHALAPLAPGDLVLLALDLAADALLRRAGERQHGEQGERERHHEEQQAESSQGHAARHARSPPVGGPGIRTPLWSVQRILHDAGIFRACATSLSCLVAYGVS